MKKVILMFALLAPAARAQKHGFNFVAPSITGRIVLPVTGADWSTRDLKLYDEGTRPVIFFVDQKSGLDLSVILFSNDTGKSTAESCRDALVPSLAKHMKQSASLENERYETLTAANGAILAIGSYLIAKEGNVPVRQQNEFGFLASASTCAEIHLSKVSFKPEDQKLFDTVLSQFTFDAEYKPALQDYVILGVAFYRNAKNFPAAALYYQRAFDLLPASEYKTTTGRYLSDQLTLSYGMAGDVKRSRAIAETAISRDPTYPLYYYNLACADAESGDALSARTHLQQAFDRRTNTLEGESFPDPASDDSIRKLKSNRDFWAFVQNLSQQLKKT